MLDNKEEQVQMDKGLMASSMKPEFSEINALNILQTPIPTAWKKQINKGGANLDYVSGDLVIRLLNKAFRNRWSFEVKDSRLIQSQDKVYVNRKTQQKTVTPQGGVIQVLGSLSVPGWGVREQWGAQVLTGGSDVQEHAFKSASTDAMKKCASMFGVALDLYGMQGASELMILPEDYLRNDEESFDKIKEKIIQAQKEPIVNPEPEAEDIQRQLIEEEASQTTQTVESTQEQAPVENLQQAQPAQQSQPVQQDLVFPDPPTTIQHMEEPAPEPVKVEVPSNRWQKEDVEAMVQLKTDLNLKDNDGLNPYVQKFMKNDSATIGKHITPGNVRDFVTFVRSNLE